MSGFSYDDPVHQELALMALAASPTPEEACIFLKSEHQIQAKPNHLTNMAKYHPEQYEELRGKIVPLKEQVLTHNLLDNALYTSNVTRVAVEQLEIKLQEGRIPAQYLSRVARDLQDLQSKAIEKKLALEGRPQTIHETRTAPEILRKLESMGVINASSEEVDEATIAE